MPDPLPPPPSAPEPLPASRPARDASAEPGASPAPEPAALELASFGSRVAARALDTGLKAVAAIVAAVVVVLSLREWFIESFSFWGDSDPLPASAVWGMMAAGAILLAIPVYEIATVAVRGQTIGKRVAKIKVVRLDSDSPPGWGRAIGRWFLPVAAFWFGLILSALIFVAVEGLVSGTSAWLGLGQVTRMLAPTLWLLVRLSAIWGRDQRGWHDYLARTRVVEA